MSDRSPFAPMAMRLIVSFAAPARVLSWAVLNGGFCHADHVINHHVRGDDAVFCAQPADGWSGPPLELGLQGKVVAMATAVEMKNLVQVRCLAAVARSHMLCDCGLRQRSFGRRPERSARRRDAGGASSHHQHDRHGSTRPQRRSHGGGDPDRHGRPCARAL